MHFATLQPPEAQNQKKNIYVEFFQSLGNRFIAGGDFNANHTVWGSRLTANKGRELLNAISHLRLCFSSTGSPTYWSSDPTKIPDLIDFCVTKGIPKQSTKCSECYDLSSEHSPIFVHIYKNFENETKKCRLGTKTTNWSLLKAHLTESHDENRGRNN